jgi:hypothetical protein
MSQHAKAAAEFQKILEGCALRTANSVQEGFAGRAGRLRWQSALCQKFLKAGIAP